MKNDLRTTLQLWLDSKQDEIIHHASELIRIESISHFNPLSPYPFGEGCAKALHYVTELASTLGFQVKNYDNYAAGVILPGKTDDTIGLFTHLDTSPVTDAWTFPPLDPTIKDGFLIGLGAFDNKTSAISCLYTLVAIREFLPQLKHTVIAVFGCGINCDMEDITHFLKSEKTPSISFIADSDFPVCIGEKGTAVFELSSVFPKGNLLDFHAGRSDKLIPDSAFALIKNVSYESAKELLICEPNCSVIAVDGNIQIACAGPGGHVAFPEDTFSPIPLLAKLLLKYDFVTPESRPLLEFLINAYHSVFADFFQLQANSEAFGDTTLVCTHTQLRNDTFIQRINIRYTPSQSIEMIENRIQQICNAHNMTCRLLSNFAPSHIRDEFRSVASALTDISNQILGTNLHEYTMGGTTYAKRLPNAIPFGPNRSDLPSAYGVGHIATEAARISDHLNQIMVYVISISRLDECFFGSP